MRILVLGINYWPEDTGIAVFNTGRCEYLAARGHDVTMCTGFPYYPAWRVPGRYRGSVLQREHRNGVTVLRSYLYVPTRVTAARRVIHEASFIASSFVRAMASRGPDVLLTVSPPLGLAVTSALLSRMWRIPYVFHVPDLQPDAAVDLGMLPSGRLARGLYAVERLAYHRAALVSTLTEAMRQRIISKGIASEKVVRFPDWADPSLFDVPAGRAGGQRFREEFGLGDRFLVVHAGNMGVKQGLDVVLEAAARSRDRTDVMYLLVGDGAMRPVLRARARVLCLPNLHFLPLQPRERFLDMLAAADVCLVTQQRVVADIVFPSKVVTLLAAARPVVASLNSSSEVARVMSKAGAGVVVPPEDAGALVEVILRLRDDPATRRSMVERGRAYARAHWDRDRILLQMEAELLGLARRDRWPRAGGRGQEWHGGQAQNVRRRGMGVHDA
jgi:colanic acid biosynthesis glycosyl transferase WcaI